MPDAESTVIWRLWANSIMNSSCFHKESRLKYTIRLVNVEPFQVYIEGNATRVKEEKYHLQERKTWFLLLYFWDLPSVGVGHAL